MSYSSLRFKAYNLGAEIGHGGEGTVYNIVGCPNQVAKIYKEEYLNDTDRMDRLEKKLKTMIDMNFDPVIDKKVRLAWPQDILYNDDGKMAGFVMPKIAANTSLFEIYRSGEGAKRLKIHPDCTWKWLIQYSYNLSWLVYHLHKFNVVIGDFNQKNVLVDKDDTIVIVDCDSFAITSPTTGEHFPCTVALSENLAPELQTVGNLRNTRFTKESDCFTLAIHLFRLLMNNEDPFNGVITNQASSSAYTGNANIINGRCPYVRNMLDMTVPSRAVAFDFLPDDIKALFRKTFTYDATNVLVNAKKRATAYEWCQVLLKYGAEEGKCIPLEKCTYNSYHVYPKHNTDCPWCGLAEKNSSAGNNKDPFPNPKAPFPKYGTPIYTPIPSPTPSYTPTPSPTPNYIPSPVSTPSYTPRPVSTPSYTPRTVSTPSYTPRTVSTPSYTPVPRNPTTTNTTPKYKYQRSSTTFWFWSILAGILFYVGLMALEHYGLISWYDSSEYATGVLIFNYIFNFIAAIIIVLMVGFELEFDYEYLNAPISTVFESIGIIFALMLTGCLVGALLSWFGVLIFV